MLTRYRVTFTTPDMNANVGGPKSIETTVMLDNGATSPSHSTFEDIRTILAVRTFGRNESEYVNAIDVLSLRKL